MLTTIQFGQEPEQFLVAPVLRPGKATGSVGAVAILERLLPRVRAAFPGVPIRVRMDGAFATPQVLAWLETQELEYFINFSKNSKLARLIEQRMKRVRRLARRSGRTETEFGEMRYRAGEWERDRRLIVKAEVTVLEGREPRDNPRFLVTNSARSPERVYTLYAARGDMENRIKELNVDLDFGRTSCSRFEANQLRNLLTAAAFILYQSLRQRAAGGAFERAQVSTLRERLVKIGVVVFESVRRILMKGPLACPWKIPWERLAWRHGAVPA